MIQYYFAFIGEKETLPGEGRVMLRIGSFSVGAFSLGGCHEPDSGNVDEAFAVNGMVTAGLVHASQILVVQ